MRQNKRGFTIVEVLIVLVVLTLVGVAGWFVYQRQNKKEEPKQTAVTNFEECKAAGYPVGESYPEQCFANGKTFVNENQKVEEPKDETSDWLLYEPPRKEYSLRIPDGWEVHRYQKESGLFSDKITFKSGTKAVIVEDEGGRDFSYLPFGLNYFDATQKPTPTGTKQKSFKTKQGADVTLYTYTQTAEPEGIGAPKDTKSYAYHITKDSKTVLVTHDVLATQTEQTALIEKAISTLEIK